MSEKTSAHSRAQVRENNQVPAGAPSSAPPARTHLARRLSRTSTTPRPHDRPRLPAVRRVAGAMALLVVVGNPAILAVDAHWRSLLRHAIATGAYVGVPPPELPEEAEGPQPL